MSYPTYGDVFDTPHLDPKKWSQKQILPHQFSFPKDRSIAVTVTDGDVGMQCSKPCQRAEIRTRRSLRPAHADEFWHGFAFRVWGDIAPTGSLRTVLAQWKAPGDDSPFLAHRFDNGVFHITVQDGPNRRVVASAKGDPDRMDKYQDLISELSAKDPEAVHMAHAIAQMRNHTGHHESSPLRQALEQQVKAVCDCEISDDQSLFDEFSYVEDLAAYALAPKLEVDHCDGQCLPDPKDDWVHMAYRIRLGRTDNNPEAGPCREGEIDIFANGNHIAAVRGNIGYQLLSPKPRNSIYFKFGVYRNMTPGTLTVNFDSFRQGRSFEDVKP